MPLQGDDHAAAVRIIRPMRFRLIVCAAARTNLSPGLSFLLTYTASACLLDHVIASYRSSFPAHNLLSRFTDLRNTILEPCASTPVQALRFHCSRRSALLVLPFVQL